MLETLLIQLDRHRRVTQACFALALIAAGFCTLRLQILDSPERWTPSTTFAAWKVFEQHFQYGDMVCVGLHFHRDVRDDDLPRLRRLRQQLAGIAGLKQVYDSSLVAEQIEAVPLTTLLDPANAARFSLYASGLWDTPQSGRQGRTLLTICELEYSANQDQATVDALNQRRRHVAAEIERIVERERQQADWGGNVDFHIAGSIVVMHEMERRTREIAYTFLPASIAVGLASFLIGFRSLRALIVAMAGSAAAMLLVLGWLAAGGGTLGTVTMAAPTLMSIVGVASAVHMAAFASEHGSTGTRFPRLNLIREVGVPCLGAAGTTGVGFLMLRFNELLPMRDLGSQLFVGSILAFLGVFLVSQWLPIGRAKAGTWLTNRRLMQYAHWITRRPRAVSYGAMAVTALLLFAAWPRPAGQALGVEFDADPFAFFDDAQPIAKALNHFSSREFGVYQLDVVLIPKQGGNGAHGLSPPTEVERANAEAARRFSEQVAARRDLGVSRVVSTQEFQRRYQEFQSQMAEVRRQQGLLAYLAQLGRYATSANVFNQTFQAWNHDKQGQGAIRITFLAHDRANGFGPLVDLVRDNLPRDRFYCYLTGSIAQNVDLTEGLSGGMLWGLASSLLIMAVLCGGLFRSVRLTLIAALPNILPIVAIYGGMALIKMPINCGSAMVMTIALGIALNDTIHFILHYRRRTREDGMSSQAAVVETIEHLGRPIVLTSAVHIAGFLIFILTDFQPLYHFGVLASITMVIALLGDLVVLPNLILVFDRREHRARIVAPLALPAAVTEPQTAECSS